MYFIVANPKSEQGRTMFHLPMLTALFDDAGIHYDVHITTGPMDAYGRTLEFCKGTSDLKGVIGIGGDGTIQELVAGMNAAFPRSSGEKIPVPLGILPSATGNDFVSTLEGSKYFAKAKYGKNTEAVCRSLFEAVIARRYRAVDVLTAGDMAFLNVGHIGLDTRIVQNAAGLKEQYDQHAYFVATFKCIARHRNIRLSVETTVEADGETVSDTNEEEFTLVAVANGQYYGGGMRVCPDAKIDDGKITLCRIRAMSRPKAMMIFPAFIFGKHEFLKSISFTECDRVKITLPQGSETLCLDGNLYPCDGEIEFGILPQALNIFM